MPDLMPKVLVVDFQPGPLEFESVNASFEVGEALVTRGGVRRAAVALDLGDGRAVHDLDSRWAYPFRSLRIRRSRWPAPITTRPTNTPTNTHARITRRTVVGMCGMWMKLQEDLAGLKVWGIAGPFGEWDQGRVGRQGRRPGCRPTARQEGAGYGMWS